MILFFLPFPLILPLSLLDFGSNNMTIRLLKITELCKMLHTSRASIYIWMREQNFPQPIRLTSRNVAWNEKDVQDWIQSRAESA